MKYLYLLIFCLAIFVRVYNFSGVPPAVYWDEVSLGYDAYSVLKTGKDHHGNPFPVVAFESYGDWKPSGYYYALIPFLAIFGLNDFTLRLPAVLAGLAIIVGVGFLAKRISLNPLIAVFVASISPWAIQFSRAGWEVTLATAAIVWAVICGFKAVEKNKISLLWQLSAIGLFIFSMYTYHVARVLAPLLALGMFFIQLIQLGQINKKSIINGMAEAIKKNRTTYGVMIICGLILLYPLLGSLGSSETTHRFQETSIFNNLDIITESNARKAAEGNSLLSKIFYHRYLLFGREVLKNYFSHFSLDFLFLSGDKNPRHSLQFIGQLYHIELIFLVIGLYAWLKRRTVVVMFFLVWLSLAIIPAAISYAAPHALRTLPALPIFLLIIATGIEELLHYATLALKKLFLANKINIGPSKISLLLVLTLGLVYMAEFLPFWTFYQRVYPVKYSQEWQYGYQELMPEVAALHAQHPQDKIYLTREKGRPAMYYWYYNQIEPARVQAQAASAKKDQGEFLEYENISFITETKEVTAEKALVVASEEFFEKLQSGYTTTSIRSIQDLDGKTVWVVGWITKK